MPSVKRIFERLLAPAEAMRRLLLRQNRKPIFAGRFFSDGTKIIQTARTTSRRRQKVKPRRRLVMAKRQRVLHLLFFSAKVCVVSATAAVFSLHVYRYATSSPGFAVAHIGVIGNTNVTAQTIIERSGINEGQNIFSIRLAAAAAAVSEIPRIRSTVVQRKLPDEIQIRVTERQPAALMLSKDLCVLDQEGKVIEQYVPSENIDAPIITGKQLAGLAVGDFAEGDGIAEALQIIALLGEADVAGSVRISEINIDDPDNIVIVAQQSGATIYLGSGDFSAKLWRLARVNDEINHNDRLQLATLERMDMRFDGIIPAKFNGS